MGIGRGVGAIGAVLAVVGGALAAGAGAWAASELRFGHAGAPDDPVAVAAERFKELVEAKTGGAVTVSLHPAGELGHPRSVLQGVALGNVDVAVAANPDVATFEPAMGVLDLPFLFDSPAHAHAVLDGEIGRGVLEKLERHNLKGLALWEIGFHELTNAVRPVRAPADLAGLTISTTSNAALAEAFRLLGAEPTPINADHLHPALATGAVDGQEGPVRAAYAGRLHEVQGHLSLTHHAYTVAPLVMNLQRFGALPSEQRRAILEAAQEAGDDLRRLNAELDAEALEAMRRAGVEVVEDPDIAAFRDAVAAAARAAYAAEHGDDVLARIDRLRTTRAAAGR